MTSRCGEFLEACTCRREPMVARDAAEMAARHAASVARAYRSGWPTAARPRLEREPAALPPLTLAQRSAAVEAATGRTDGPGTAQGDSAPVPVDPTGRGWATTADTIRDTRRGAA